MKKLFAILFPAMIFLFSSCSILKKDYWVAIKYFNNDTALQVSYDKVKGINYININKNDIIDGKYFLIPNSKDSIIITSIKFDNRYFSLLSYNEPVISFQAINNGITTIEVKTKNNGCSSMEFRIQ